MTQPIAQYLFTASDPRADSMGNYPITNSTTYYYGITINALPTEFNFEGGAATFNGTTSCRILLSSSLASLINGNKPRTIEFWAYISGTGTNYATFFQYGNGASRTECSIRMANGQDILTFNWGHSSYNVGASSYINKWSHFVYVYPGTNIGDERFYLNNKEYLRAPADTTLNTATTEISIGYNRISSGRVMTGRFTNFRFYDQALSAQEVARHYITEYHHQLTPTTNFLYLPRRDRWPGSVLRKSV